MAAVCAPAHANLLLEILNAEFLTQLSYAVTPTAVFDLGKIFVLHLRQNPEDMDMLI